MAIQEPANLSTGRSYRAAWIVAAIIAVMMALGAVHLLGSIPVFGVKPVAESGEVPVEVRPLEPTE